MSEQPNISLQASISRAIAVRAARLGRTLKSIRLAAGYPTTTFQDRYKGRRPWNTNDVDRLAKALDLPDGFALYAIARREAGLSED